MITLGKAIYSILTGNTTVRNAVQTKIYPVVIPAETLAPVVVFERSAITDYTRDLLNGYVNTVDITIITDEYTEGITIADAVNTALGSYKGSIQGINIVDVRLENLAETYAENQFMQKLTFTIRAN